VTNEPSVIISKTVSLDTHRASTRTADLYLARDSRFSGKVFIWLLRHSFSFDTNAIQRFVRRIETIKTLVGQSIAILDSGVDSEGVAYVEFQELSGSLLEEKRVQPREAERLFQKAVETIAGIHSQNLVCGDISGSSFWVTTEGTLKFIGLMGSFDVEASSTSVAPPIETYHYLAPEQRAGSSITTESDVYSLGVLGYFLFTGRYPAGDNKNILLGNPDTSKIRLISDITSGVPAWADQLIPWCLGKSPRVADAKKLLDSMVNFRQRENEVGVKTTKQSSDSNESIVLSQTSENISLNQGTSLLKSDPRFQISKGLNSSTIGSPIKAARNAPGGDALKKQQALSQEKSESTIENKVFVLIGVVLSALLVVGTTFGYFLFTKKYSYSNTDLSSASASVSSEFDEFRQLLLADKDKNEITRVISKLLSDKSGQSFNRIADFIQKAKSKHPESATTAQNIFVQKVTEKFSKWGYTETDKLFSSGSLDACYVASLETLNSKLPIQKRIQSLKACYAIAPPGAIKLSGILALELGNKWAEIYKELISHDLKLADANNKSLEALILLQAEAATLLGRGYARSLLEKTSDSDVVWLFNSLKTTEGVIFSLVSERILKLNLVKAPRESFLRPLAEDAGLPEDVRKVLVDAVAGKASPESVGVINNWLNIRAIEVLLALCADSTSKDVHERAFDAVSTKVVDRLPTKDLLKWLKEKGWRGKRELGHQICELGFYSDLPQARKVAIVKEMSSQINNSDYIFLIAKGQNIELVKDLLKEYGQNLGLSVLLHLLNNSDPEVRISSLNNLKWYSELGVYRQILTLYRKEKDPEVLKAYEDNFWYVKQQK
jgi:hypothetical protein